MCSVKGCESKHRSKGFCSRHYQRVRRYGRINRIMPSETHSFIFKYINTTIQDCILWPYKIHHTGYAHLTYDGNFYHAHNLSLRLSKGPPPSPNKSCALHSCRNRHCINPNHLDWGSYQDNKNDTIRDETNHRPKARKLTEGQVRFIRDSKLCNKDLAKIFNINSTSIWKVKNYKTYKDII